jgi:hypothetical protein
MPKVKAGRAAWGIFGVQGAKNNTVFHIHKVCG